MRREPARGELDGKDVDTARLRNAWVRALCEAYLLPGQIVFGLELFPTLKVEEEFVEFCFVLLGEVHQVILLRRQRFAPRNVLERHQLILLFVFHKSISCSALAGSVVPFGRRDSPYHVRDWFLELLFRKAAKLRRCAF